MTTEIDRETTILATDSNTLSIGLVALLLSIPPINHVKCVRDVQSLLDALADIHPILIILDTSLGGAQVPEIVRHIHRLSPGSHAVLLSENMAEFRELAYTSPATVLVKGADPAHLARTIETLLENHFAV